MHLPTAYHMVLALEMVVLLQHFRARARTHPLAACLLPPPCRYEDNFDAVNNVAILSLPSDKGSIDGYGAPDKFLEQINFLFGKQTFTGGTDCRHRCC